MPSRCAREPGNELLGIAPAYVGDGRVILAGCHEPACLRAAHSFLFANGDRILTDRNG